MKHSASGHGKKVLNAFSSCKSSTCSLSLFSSHNQFVNLHTNDTTTKSELRVSCKNGCM